MCYIKLPWWVRLGGEQNRHRHIYVYIWLGRFDVAILLGGATLIFMQYAVDPPKAHIWLHQLIFDSRPCIAWTHRDPFKGTFRIPLHRVFIIGPDGPKGLNNLSFLAWIHLERLIGL